eukprot:9521999-Alexandrium_andersonii.AAC.1
MLLPRLGPSGSSSQWRSGSSPTSPSYKRLRKVSVLPDAQCLGGNFLAANGAWIPLVQYLQTLPDPGPVGASSDGPVAVRRR